MLVLSHLSVQLTLGDFGGFDISTEDVAICCFLALQTADGFRWCCEGKISARVGDSTCLYMKKFHQSQQDPNHSRQVNSGLSSAFM